MWGGYMSPEEMIIYNEGAIKQLRKEVDIMQKIIKELLFFNQQQVGINYDLRKLCDNIKEDK